MCGFHEQGLRDQERMVHCSEEGLQGGEAFTLSFSQIFISGPTAWISHVLQGKGPKTLNYSTAVWPEKLERVD